MKGSFLDRLIERMDRVDPASLQTHFLRLARERGLLETVFQSIQEGLLVIDGQGKLRYANKAAERLLGVSLESAQGRSIARFVRDIDWDSIMALDTGEWSRLITQEIEINYPEHRFVSFYVVPLATEQGGAGEADEGALVLLRDVTHERQQESSLLESERLKAVKLLAAGVAHEIGNPLNALNIHLQLLERELEAVADAAQRTDLLELAGVAREEVGRLDMIITQFLRAIRPGEPNFQTEHIERVLESTLKLLRTEIENRRITVEVDSSGELPAVRIDRDQMKQAFFNIIKNAFHAMHDGGALRIHVSASAQHMAVAFRDDGHGIPAEQLGRVFEPYHTTKADGSGLGLMIVQRIVQDHGGRIEVASREGVGTCFTVVLPLAERRVRMLARAGHAQRLLALEHGEDVE